MGYVDINPDADLGGYPLISTITGAATRWQALSDGSDATYVAQDVANVVDGIDFIGFANPSIPAGAVVTYGEVYGRVHHAGINSAYAFSLYAEPKDQYKSPYAPNNLAECFNVYGDNSGNWFFATPVGSVQAFSALYASTWSYNNGLYAYDYLSWDKIDLDTLQMYIKYKTPGSAANRVMKAYLRIYYDEIPVVASIQPADLAAGETHTTTPTIQWSYSDADGKPQTMARVRIIRAGTYDSYGHLVGASGFQPDTAIADYESGTLFQSSTSHTIGPTGLENLVNYYAYVRVWHAPVQGNEMRSNWATSASFLVDGVAPQIPTISAVANDILGRVEIDVVEGNWNATPLTDYLYLQRSVADGDYVDMRDGVNVSLRDGLRTGSTTNNLVASPAHASFDITGDIAIKACIALEGAIGDHYIISKMHLGLGNSWQFKTDTTGKLRFTFNKAGVLTDAVSPSAIPLPSAKTPFWVRCNHVSTSNWNTTFYYSLDPPDTDPAEIVWTSLGTFTGSGSGTITNFSTDISLNGYGLVGQSTFRIYYVELFNSFGVLVANPDFRDSAFGDSVFTDAVGRGWTIYLATPNMSLGFFRRFDYELLEQQNVKYRTQAITLDSGSPVGTAWQATANVQLSPYGHNWWFKVIGSESLNYKFDLLPDSWDADRPADAAAFSPLGRSRKIVVSDGTKGAEQTLEVECLSVADYNAIVAIYEAQQVVWVVAYGVGRYLAFTHFKDKRHTLTNGYSVVALKAVEVDSPMI
jgi:hypothetical protein